MKRLIIGLKNLFIVECTISKKEAPRVSNMILMGL